MGWMERVRRVLEIDEQELNLWSRIAAAQPHEGTRSIIQAMMENQRKNMEELRELLRRHSYMDP